MFDVLVEFFVRARSLGGVEVAAAYDMAIRRIEVQGIRNIIEIAKREVL